MVRGRIGPGYVLIRVARWQEGLAFPTALGIGSIGSATSGKLRWVGREEGSGARRCLDELLGDRPPPRRQARDHRGVAEAIRCGWADVGVCHRLAGAEAGLGFLGIRDEDYDLCLPGSWADDPRLVALVGAIRGASYRDRLGELPGYDTAGAGEFGPIDP